MCMAVAKFLQRSRLLRKDSRSMLEACAGPQVCAQDCVGASERTGAIR